MKKKGKNAAKGKKRRNACASFLRSLHLQKKNMNLSLRTKFYVLQKEKSGSFRNVITFLRRTKTIFMEKYLFSLAIFNFNFVVN